MTFPLVSIIIRTKNEEKWISACLQSVFSQDYPNFEVVVVDNKSTDLTVRRAKQFPVTIVEIEHFKPGLAINLGIRASKGEILVCLSGHCVPIGDDWLRSLVAPLSDPKIAGVYGRQEPLSFTNPLDKRDLCTVFGLDAKLQKKDFFFHNANSAFTRSIWGIYPFDEDATNIEDRIWGKQMIEDGYFLYYEPSASVYHHHGINHALDQHRADKIVKIMQTLDCFSSPIHAVDPLSLSNYCFIPILGPPIIIEGQCLLTRAIECAKKSKLISSIIVLTDNEETAKFAKSLGVEVPFLRPSFLADDTIQLKDILSYCLQQLEDHGHIVDTVISIDQTYPFRKSSDIDACIELLLSKDLDEIVATFSESRSIISQSSNSNSACQLDPISTTRNSRIAMFGYCYITRPKFLRSPGELTTKSSYFNVTEDFTRLQIKDIITMTKLKTEFFK